MAARDPMTFLLNIDMDPKDSNIEQKKSMTERDRLSSIIGEVLKIGGFFYALGFTVIMIHTYGFRVPVIEALKVQNILAGLPLGLLLYPALIVWRRMASQIAEAIRKSSETSRKLPGWLPVLIVLGLVLGLGIAGLPVWLFLKAAGFLSPTLRVLTISGVLTLLSIPLVWEAYSQRHVIGQSISWIIMTGLLIFFLAACYVLLLYPRIPQSLGGGRPELVQLYVGSDVLSSMVSVHRSPNGNTHISEPVLLYYRTSDYLLIRKSQDQPFIYVRANEIRAIVWIASQMPPNHAR